MHFSRVQAAHEPPLRQKPTKREIAFMQKHIKDIGKYTAKAALLLALVMLLGIITSGTTFIWGLIGVIFKQGATVPAAHTGAGFAIFINILFHPVSAVLWLIAGVILPIVYFSMANKFALRKLIHKILQNKSDSLIYPVFDRLLSEIKVRQPIPLKSGTDYGLKKLQVMESIKHGNGNALIKRIVIFGLKKVKLNDVDLNKEGQDFYDVLKVAAVQQLQQISKPAWWPLLLVMGIQWLFLYAILHLPI